MKQPQPLVTRISHGVETDVEGVAKLCLFSRSLQLFSLKWSRVGRKEGQHIFRPSIDNNTLLLLPSLLSFAPACIQ